MKKLKIIVASVLAVAALGACAAAVGCKKNESHTHTYAWTWDKDNHWRQPTCGHDVENLDYGEHHFEDGVCHECGYVKEAGLEVSKTTTVYKLTSPKRTIPTSDISVSLVDRAGNKKTLEKEDFTLTYYKGKEQINSMANLSDGGAYNIWATVETETGVTLEGFVVVYLVEDVSSFKRNDEFVGDSTVTQDLGRDVISDKWNYDVTYSSGRKETVNVRTDPRITRTGFSTYIAGSGKTSNVKFSYTNCIGEENSFEDNVMYTVNKKENSDVVYNAYSFEDFTANLTEMGVDVSASTIKLTQENFTGRNAFLTLLDGTVNYRGTQSDSKNGGLKLIDMRGEALSVTFEGEGIIEIKGRSNGESAYSAIAVLDEAGEYMTAIYTPSKYISKDDNDNIYAITGSSMNTLSFEIPKAGKYTIVTIDEVLVDDNTIDTSNPVRLGGLATTDILNKEGN